MRIVFVISGMPATGVKLHLFRLRRGFSIPGLRGPGGYNKRARDMRLFALSRGYST